MLFNLFPELLFGEDDDALFPSAAHVQDAHMRSLCLGKLLRRSAAAGVIEDARTFEATLDTMNDDG